MILLSMKYVNIKLSFSMYKVQAVERNINEFFKICNIQTIFKEIDKNEK